MNAITKEQSVRTLQIIVFAMATGLAIFAGVAFSIGEQNTDNPPTMSYVAAVVAAGMFLARFVIGPSVVAAQRRQIPREGWSGLDSAGRFSKLFPVLQTKTIVENAIVEAAGFLAGVAYLVEGQIWTLVILAACAVIILMSVPTLGRIEEWIDDQTQIIESEMI